MTVNEDQLRVAGQEITARYEALGWTQTELAERSGFSDTTIRKIERGIKVAPGTLRKVRETLGIEPLADQREREGFPAPIERVRKMVGNYMISLPEDEWQEVGFAIARLLLELSTERMSPGE